MEFCPRTEHRKRNPCASDMGFSYWAANIILAIAAFIILAYIVASVRRLLGSRTSARPFCAVVGTPYGPKIWDGVQRKYVTRTLFVLWNRGLSKITTSDIEPGDPVTIEVEGPILEFQVCLTRH